MDITDVVRDTFTAHERLAPDEREVLADVHKRIDDRRSNRVRLLAVAASVAVVGATSAAVLLSRGSDSNRHADSPPAPAAATTHTAPQQATPTRASKPPATAIAPLTMPYDLGWLPAGSVSYLARRVNVGGTSDHSAPAFDGEYLLTVTTATGRLMVDVQQMPGGLSGVGFKSGPGSAITINGRPGVESSRSGGQGGYEVYFRNTDGAVTYVNVAHDNSATGEAARLTALGRRVAENVRFPGTYQVHPDFGIGYLPPGLRVRTFDVGVAGTSYGIGRTQTTDSSVNVGTNIAVSSTGTPGRSVQGHQTRVKNEHGYRTLYVLGAVHGATVQIAGGVPLAELYKIADGLRLPD